MLYNYARFSFHFQIVYPLGCHLHICEFRSVPLLPLLLFDMDVTKSADLFTSKRPGWPYEAKIIGFPVFGAVQVIQGVVEVIICHDHSNTQLRKQVSLACGKNNQYLNNVSSFS
jgi:hypothetical protein